MSCRKSESLGPGAGDHEKVTTWVDGFKLSVPIWLTWMDAGRGQCRAAGHSGNRPHQESCKEGLCLGYCWLPALETCWKLSGAFCLKLGLESKGAGPRAAVGVMVSPF